MASLQYWPAIRVYGTRWKRGFESWVKVLPCSNLLLLIFSSFSHRVVRRCSGQHGQPVAVCVYVSVCVCVGGGGGGGGGGCLSVVYKVKGMKVYGILERWVIFPHLNLS